MRITVIGAGFLGNALALGAARRGWSATVVSRSDPFGTQRANPGPGEVRLLSGDGVERLPQALEQGADAIVIAAGGHFPLPSTAAPVADAIATLSLVIGLCETVRSLSPSTKIVFLSSAGAVYSPGDELKCEADSGKPTSPYGMSRRMGEEYMEFYRREHGLFTYSLRCSNVYGRLLPQSRGQGVVPAAFWSALNGSPFILHGDGRQVRDFIYIDDFVTATLGLLESGQDIPGVINVGAGVGNSIADVLDAVRAATGFIIPTKQGPSAHADVGKLVVDLSLLRSIIDFDPLNLNAGIRLMASEIEAGGFPRNSL